MKMFATINFGSLEGHSLSNLLRGPLDAFAYENQSSLPFRV